MSFYANDTTGRMILTLDGVDVSDCVINSYQETWESENSEEFRIGCFPSREVKFDLDIVRFKEKFPLAMPPLAENWVMKWGILTVDGDSVIEDIIDGGTFILADVDEDYDGNATVTLYDRAILADVPYNFTKLDYEVGTTTVAQINEIATHLGYTVDGIANVRSKEVKWQDGIMSVRTHIEYIAELSGCNVYMTRDNKLRFAKVKPTLPQVDIPMEYIVDEYKQGDTVTFTRTLWNNGVQEYLNGDDSGSTLYVSSNNPYIDVQADIDFIHNIVSGLTITNVPTLKAFGNPTIDLFDNIRLIDQGVERCTILVNALTLGFSQGFSNTLTANIQSAQYERVAQYFGDATIKRMQVLIDNNKQLIEFSFASQTEFENYVNKFIRFTNGEIQIGEELGEDNLSKTFTYMMVIRNDGMVIGKVDRETNGFEEVAYFKADKMLITKAEIQQSLQIGNVAFYRESNGSMSLKKAIV